MNILEKFRLDGQVAVVTGASKGLGRAIACGFGEVGAKVVAVSRSRELIEQTAEEIRAKGGEAAAIPMDVTKNDQIEAMMNQVIEKFGRLDILVNNAGIGPMRKAVDISMEEWDQVVDTNLRAVFVLSQAAGRIMIEQKKGNIINVGSILGLSATMFTLHYCTTKSGVIQMTRALALEWARYNIRVNCLVPGYVETEMVRHLQENESAISFLLNKIPMKRLGHVQEIVGAAVFLASEASAYATGSTLVVDGGYTIW